jgi:uncharacterized protein (TIGR00369 family)
MSRIYLPTSPGCFGCGQDNHNGLQMHLYIEDGKSKVDLVTDERFRGYEDRLHGGIIFSILDEVMAWAPTYARKRMCVSAEITIRFLHPLPIGIPITVEGEFVNDRRLIWDTAGRILGRDSTVYARAKGKYLPITKDKTLQIDDKMIYPAGMKSIFRY